MIGLVALLATVIGVFAFLPAYVAKHEAHPSEPFAPGSDRATRGDSTERRRDQPATAAEPTHDRPLESSAAATASQRQRAEAALGKWLQAQARLEAKQVAQWGRVAYGEAKAKAAAGDGAFQQADYGTASARYREAAATLEQLEQTIPEVLENALQAGDAALASGDAKGAQQAFKLALALEPEHPRAKRGLERTTKLEQILTLLARGEAHEREGRLALAYADFQTAVRLDSQLPRLQAALARVEESIANESFQAAMSEGFSALEGGRFQEALTAFQRAQGFRPQASEVEDGIAQAEEGLRLAKIEDFRQRARDMESAERWEDALAAYEGALAIDATLAFAQQGRARSQQLGQVAAKLKYYLEQPQLLTSDRVYRRARAFLAQASMLAPHGPKLQAQLRRFEEQLALAGTPLQLELRSDAATEVMIYQVGKLGRFATKTIELRPGTYTVVGVRPGYRDVRRRLTLTPGEPPSPVYIACQERV